jgi:small subunit ribosomal protein S17
MDKTVVVAVNTTKEHPIYRKKYKVTTRFKAHDAENLCKEGDLVEITETRPLSKDKRWEVARKVSAKEMEA